MGKISEFLKNIKFESEYDGVEDDNFDEDVEIDDDGVEEEAQTYQPQQHARPAQARPEPSQGYKRAGGIETIKPATYSDAHKIVEKLKEGNIIVFSLELVDDELAVRILDFVYGGTFAVGGKIKEVGTRVYVVTSAGISLSEITADSQQKATPNYR